MNIESIFELMKKQREENFSKSNQFTLGKLIDELQSIELKTSSGEYKDVYFDFGYFSPTFLESWRGSYDEISLGYSEGNSIKVDRLIQLLNGAIGETFEGYKGGDFVMYEHTPLWIANYGNSGNTGVIGVHDRGWSIVLLTSYFEY